MHAYMHLRLLKVAYGMLRVALHGSIMNFVILLFTRRLGRNSVYLCFVCSRRLNRCIVLS